MADREARKRPQEMSGAGSRPVEWLTQIAFVLAMALVVARATTTDQSKERGVAMTSETPRAGGPAAAMGLDLLCCVPAILVLARRVSDRAYVLRWSWSILAMGLLAVMGVASTLWASNKFWAMLEGFHLIAALAMLWAGSQLVRSWLRLRMVGAVLFGLLLAYFAYSLMYRLVDVPDLKKHFDQYRSEILKEQGLSDDPFRAKQFENKSLSGELIGFFGSANTMAAMVVLLLIVTIGLGVQRRMDDPADATGIGILIIGVPAAIWMIWAARSKTAGVTPVIAVAALAAAWHWRGALAREARRVYWAGVGAVTVGALAVVGHGLYHGGLVSQTLTFRWHYWVGAMRVFARHPLVGVGLENFGAYYVGVRLPEAPEEVKDPHNFLVRFLAELGLIGGVLCLAWLGRLAWELTRPVTPVDVLRKSTAGGGAPYVGMRAISAFVWIAGIGLAISVLSGVDFSADKGYVVFEILKRFSLFALLLVGASVGAIKSLQAPELDGRPAPVLLYAMLIGLAMFMVHNLVDFSLFEPGPMIAFAFLAGSVLGVRQPSVAGQKKRTAIAAVALGASIVLWLVAAGFVWAPTAAAEDAVGDAGVALRHGRALEALRLLNQARVHQPLNADYAFRAATVAMAGSGTAVNREALALLDLAIRGDPMETKYYLARARYLLQSEDRAAQREQILKDFRRALELDPNQVSLHVEFAEALRGLGTPADRAEAAREYETALKYNALLKADEPKRLSEAKVAEIKKLIEELRQPATQPVTR
ncbi:MAG: lipid core-O-antigen ligase-like enyme [Phycisphaerales bacterium]|nr:lipid core-O-antigen ligase-like enyme [Phycisphaerales bacterium]